MIDKIHIQRSYSNSGFIGILFALLVGVASMATGAVVYNNLTTTLPPGIPQGSGLIMVEDQATKNLHWPSLQLKTFTFITITPTPSQITASVVDCGYPYASANPRSNIKSDENEVLRGFAPVIAGPGDQLKVWVNDEHASILGVRQIQVKTLTGTNITDYPVSPLTSSPGSAIDPQTGSNLLDGDQAGTDVAGRPIWPSLFITDITQDPNNKSGDWQAGGIPINPHAVFGSWKAAVKIVDTTVSPPAVKFLVQPNPARNDWDLDGGGPAPDGLENEGFGMEVRWDVNRLVTEGKIQIGHTYRVQFIVHDGDQTKTGGDVGEACATVRL